MGEQYGAFISHASADEPLAGELRDALEAAGIKTFFAPGGAQMRQGNFLEQLARAVKTSNALVLMLSKASANSKNVRWEAKVASEHGCDIIPVLVEDVDLAMDNSLYVLTFELQQVRLFPDRSKGVARLIELLGGRMRAASGTPAPAPVEAAGASSPASEPVPRQKFDRAKFVSEVRARADRNDREALYVLGRLHQDGFGVAKDEAQAARLYRLASEGDNGLPEAMHALANCYRKERGVGRDFARMHKFYQSAAERGFAPSMYYLGRAYEAGWGVPADNAKAYHWYQKAAKVGSAPAQYAAARMALAGIGTPVNDANALSFAQMASRQHYGPALNLMGRLYRKGRGVAQNDVEACRWYKRGVEQGDSDAALNLGSMYERGLGVERDADMAGALFALSQALRQE